MQFQPSANRLRMNRRGHDRHPERNRGSVMVLVVIVLVLMAMLGTAYIQVCRMDRIATQMLEGGNIDAVTNATLTYIGDVLRNDLVDKDRNLFNNASSLNGTIQTGYDESYDHPWTATTVPFNVALSSGTDTAAGGAFDDTWLASTTPDFETDVTKPRWKHVSNLNLIGLRIPKLGGANASPTLANGGEYGLIPTNAAPETDTNLIITGDPAAMDDATSTDWEPFGADADADGVPDSLWTWAPIRQISGVTYVMAVRIVDSSALLNVNTATILHNQGQFDLAGMSPTATDLPRGLLPTDADMARLLARGGVSAPTWINEMHLFLGSSIRGLTPDGNGVIPTGLTLATWPAAGSWAAGSRLGDFLDRIRFNPGYSTTVFSIKDELEMRYRNGLNDVNTAYTVESLMPTLLRSGTTVETDYRDPVNAASLGVSTDAERMMAYFQGASSSAPTSATEPIKDRTYPALRQMLTTRSGANAWAPNLYSSVASYTNAANTYRRVRWDLSRPAKLADGVTPFTAVQQRDAIYDRIYNTVKIGANAAPFAYLGINPTTQDWLLQQLAAEYTLAIMDYQDADLTPSTMTVAGVPGVNFYGLESLPFLREAYVQAGYVEIDNQDAGGLAVGDVGYTVADNTYDTWQVVPGSHAMVIEIGNPFDKAIDLAGAGMPAVRVAVIQGGTEVSTADLAATSLVLSPRDPTGADETDEQAMLYSNPATAVTEDGGTEGAAPLTDLEVDALVPGAQKAAVSLTYFADGTDIQIALQVDVGGGTFVTYDRLAVPGVAVPSTVPFLASTDWVAFVPGAPPAPLPRTRHYQQSVKRDGQFIRYLSNLNAATAARSPNTANYAKRSATPVDQFWIDNKGIVGEAQLDVVQLPAPNRPMLSLAELGQVFMLGFHDGVDGDLPTRLTLNATPPVDTNNPRRWTLDLTSTAVVPSGATNAQVPHAAMLMAQFTTVSPRFDDKDNLNTDGDNDVDTNEDQIAEMFVPGTINVNTAPLHILTLAAALPEAVNDIEMLMREVVAYRDANTSAARNAITGLTGTTRGNPGIAHIGELMFINPAAPTGGWSPSMTPGTDVHAQSPSMQRYAIDTTPENLTAGSPVDMYPAPEEVATIRFDNLDGSAEAKLARFQFLTQLLSTRSDVFVAYVYIRGYPAGDFRTGPLESKRVLAIFDRSGVVNGDETVRMIDKYEFPN